jgi:hypothetical protein
MDGNMIAHPYRSDSEVAICLNWKTYPMRKIFQKFIDICKKDKAGFATYIWQEERQKKNLQEKISFIELYEPWTGFWGAGFIFRI